MHFKGNINGDLETIKLWRLEDLEFKQQVKSDVGWDILTFSQIVGPQFPLCFNQGLSLYPGSKDFV